MRNRLLIIPNHVIMAVTTVVSTLLHGSLFLMFGGCLFLAITTLGNDGNMSVLDYETIIALFALLMYHCLALIFLLEKSPRTRTWGFSVVTAVLEVVIIPVYALIWLGVIPGTYGYAFIVPVAMMLVSLVGNIYCVVRHTILK